MTLLTVVDIFLYISHNHLLNYYLLTYLFTYMFQVSPELSASTPTATVTETTRYSIWIRIRNDFRLLLYTVLRKRFATTFANLDRFPSLALPVVGAVGHVSFIDSVFVSVYACIHAIR